MNTIKGPNRVIAIKQHKCNFCDEKILAGETYISSTHTYYGDIYTWKCHQLCNDIADKLRMYDDCDEGLTMDDFMECIKNEYTNIDPEGDKTPAKAKFKETLDFVLDHHFPFIP
jgi:hypothetical protein